jgi:SAM-dependent methyltransferase
MEHPACDFCGGRDAVEVTRQTDILHRTTDTIFTIVRCTGCGLQFVNPRPSRKEIGRYYADHYSFHEAPSRIRLLLSDVMDRLANGPLYWLFSWIPHIDRKLAVRIKPNLQDPVRQHLRAGARLGILDIGCGAGVSAHFWGHAGALQSYKKLAPVCGIEVDDDARRALEKTGIRAYPSLASVPANDLFDIIRMNWSLEHVHSPADYFEFIAAHLDAAGKAIIAVPNYDGVLYRLANDCVELPIHLYHFRRQDIAAYAEKNGLRVVEFISFSYPEMFVVASRTCRSLQGSFDSGLRTGEARAMQKTLSRLDSLGLGNDMLFVLEKAT